MRPSQILDRDKYFHIVKTIENHYSVEISLKKRRSVEFKKFLAYILKKDYKLTLMNVGMVLSVSHPRVIQYISLISFYKEKNIYNVDETLEELKNVISKS